MSLPLNKQWLLKSRPEGLVKPSDFSWNEEAIPQVSAGQVLVRNLMLSLDPASRGWMREARSYIPPVKLGSVMRGIAIGEVVDSGVDHFKEGMLVQGMIGWQTHKLFDAAQLTPVAELPGVPLEAHLAVLSHIGLTAYFGLLDIGKPQAGETLVVSAAAGAVGSLVGQIGKIKGLRVVGIAGSDDKCSWIVDELGFDAAINYKSENVLKALHAQCPDGIDIYFDNVGGSILNAALALINDHARIPVCGMISVYNASEPVPGPSNIVNLIPRRGRMEGFIVTDYMGRAMECMMALARWMGDGKIRYRVDIVEGLEQAPEALGRLFDGKKNGKLLVRVGAR